METWRCWASAMRYARSISKGNGQWTHFTMPLNHQKTYPLQKKRHGIDFLREITHLRPRSNVYSAASRIRNSLFAGFHDYFQGAGFQHVHTPLFTSSDCEGAGETFQVLAPQNDASPDEPPHDQNEICQGSVIKGPCSDYFGTPQVNLTVSGQLHLEIFAHAHPRVYTLSPAFRAEKTLSTRHLAEFYMLEAEVSFVTSLEQLIDLTTACVRGAVERVDRQDVELLAGIAQRLGGTSKAVTSDVVGAAMDRLEMLAARPYAAMTYTEAIDFLAHHKRSPQFEFPVQWGVDLQAEHEKFLAHDLGRPVFVTHYPKALKPFYMLVDNTAILGSASDDSPARETVANFDLLVPDIGELAGGSLRAHDQEVMVAQLRDAGQDPEAYAWYTDLRKYGSVPHGGFGLGFDRLVKHLTGLHSVRDVVPIPRYYGECRY